MSGLAAPSTLQRPQDITRHNSLEHHHSAGVPSLPTDPTQSQEKSDPAHGIGGDRNVILHNPLLTQTISAVH